MFLIENVNFTNIHVSNKTPHAKINLHVQAVERNVILSETEHICSRFEIGSNGIIRGIYVRLCCKKFEYIFNTLLVHHVKYSSSILKKYTKNHVHCIFIM